jgi:hypothetical protein
VVRFLEASCIAAEAWRCTSTGSGRSNQSTGPNTTENMSAVTRCLAGQG